MVRIKKKDRRILKDTYGERFVVFVFSMFKFGVFFSDRRLQNLCCFFFQAGTKLLCAVLSLPVPSKSTANASGDQLHSANSRSILDHLEHRTLQKILLVGNSGSGTSTIFKQV